VEDEEEGGFSDRVGDVPEISVRAPSTAVVDDEVDLFSSSSIPTIPNSKPTSTPQPTLTNTRTQIRIRTITRDLPTATATTLSTAHTHKTTGTQAFKLGQYAAASDAYGLAISILPPHHLLLLPLYTNRALARLKTGEYADAAEDCSLALSIITAGESSWTPASESEDPRILDRGKANEGGWTHPQGLGVDLCDQYVKALKRRALAFEGREKWGDAGKDWEVLAGMRVELVEEKTRGEAVMGAGRCRRMYGGDNSGSATPAVKPRPKPKAKPTPTSTSSNSSTSTPTPSAALTALQTQTAQAEADLTLQYTLKDTIDARLGAWRKGKESNIRALLASLDAVLWAEVLHGVKVGGMAELVSPVQVKKAYVRAIGRVHPDKVGY
jgi:tetratricopeptide (TPR) repeat protein